MDTSSRLKVGEVVQIRVNPEDVMTCIDLAVSSNMPIDQCSLAMIISQALKGMCNYVRDNSLNGIQPRDGYEYSDMIAPFVRRGQGVKLLANKTYENTEKARVAVDMPASSMQISQPVQESDAIDTPAMQRRRGNILARIMELNERAEVDPDNYTNNDKEELMRLQEEYESVLPRKPA